MAMGFFRQFVDLLKVLYHELFPEQEVVPDAGRPYKVQVHGRKDTFGRMGENEAVRFLKRKRHRILERNLRMPSCEIDIIAWDTKRLELVFVEVKTRRSDAFGAPADEVDTERMDRMRRAAREYVRWKKVPNAPIRFDVLGILWPAGQRPSFDYHPKAFR
ncbi:MAG: YraN family protein [Planctomycetia bacterium]|nr:YraN family protein [Planctomycetia bacterium]